MNKGVKIAIELVLLVIAIYLSYKIYETIMVPIRFQKAYKQRSEVVKKKLMLIRDLEVAYLSKYGHYTANWDSLINFAKHDSIIVIKAYGVVPDSLYLLYGPKKAEKKALEMGIIRRDTVKIAVRDTILKEPIDLDTLKYIPYTHLKEEFQINAGYLMTQANVKMPVFEVKAHNNTFLKGLNRQL